MVVLVVGCGGQDAVTPISQTVAAATTLTTPSTTSATNNPTLATIPTTTPTTPSTASSSPVDLAGVTQPILDSDLCTTTWGRMVSGGMQVVALLERVSSQPIAAQFIGHPADSLTQPFMLVERFVADYELPADFTSDVDVNGSAARVDWVDGAESGGITWRLADGSEAFLRSQGFTRDDSLALARSLIQRPADSNVPGFDVQAGNPFGVAVIDETNGNIVNPRRAASSCRLDNGSTVTVNIFERYLVAVAAFIIDHPEEHVLAARDLPGADDRVLVLTGRGEAPLSWNDVARHTAEFMTQIRQATPQEWADLETDLPEEGR